MKKETHSTLALKAMKRAARAALERAASKNLKMPVWKDGKIIYIDAKAKLAREQSD